MKAFKRFIVAATLAAVLVTSSISVFAAQSSPSPISITKKVAVKNTVYTGKARKGYLSVKDGNKTLKLGIDYTVSYKNNTNPGIATVTVKGIGAYTGTVTKTFKIAPKAVTIKTPRGSKKKATIKWKAQKNITGYQIKLVKGKTTKTVTVSSYKTSSKTIKSLAKGTWKVTVRSYKTSGKTRIYGAWSKTKSVKVK